MSEVTTENAGRTRLITINRPEARNSLTLTVLASLREAFAAASVDPEARVVVLSGAGGHFCAGADLRKNMEDPRLMERTDDYMDEFHSVIKAIVECPKPVIAM